MKKALITKIVVLSLLVLFLGGALIFGISSGFGLKDFVGESGSAYASDETRQYTQPVEEIENLDIEWIAGYVEVKPYSGTEIRITEEVSRKVDEEERLRLEQDGDTLRIRWKKSNQLFSFFSWGFGKRLTVEIPESMLLDRVKVNATSADVVVGSLSAEEFELRSTSGSVEGSALKGEEAVLETTSGDIRSEDSAFEKLKVGTTSGGIRLTGTRGTESSLNSVSGGIEYQGSFRTLKANSVSGGIEAVTDILTDAVKLESVSGSVGLTVPENTEAKVKYNSISGEFRSSLGSDSFSGKNGEFAIGSGTGTIEFSTTSGSMKLSSGVKAAVSASPAPESGGQEE